MTLSTVLLKIKNVFVYQMNHEDSLQLLEKHCWSSTFVKLKLFSLLTLIFWIIVQAHNLFFFFYHFHLFTKNLLKNELNIYILIEVQQTVVLCCQK